MQGRVFRVANELGAEVRLEHLVHAIAYRIHNAPGVRAVDTTGPPLTCFLRAERLIHPGFGVTHNPQALPDFPDRKLFLIAIAVANSERPVFCLGHRLDLVFLWQEPIEDFLKLRDAAIHQEPGRGLVVGGHITRPLIVLRLVHLVGVSFLITTFSLSAEAHVLTDLIHLQPGVIKPLLQTTNAQRICFIRKIHLLALSLHAEICRLETWVKQRLLVPQALLPLTHPETELPFSHPIAFVFSIVLSSSLHSLDVTLAEAAQSVHGCSSVSA